MSYDIFYKHRGLIVVVHSKNHTKTWAKIILTSNELKILKVSKITFYGFQ